MGIIRQYIARPFTFAILPICADLYWSKKGRKSIYCLTLAIAFLSLLSDGGRSILIYFAIHFAVVSRFYSTKKDENNRITGAQKIAAIVVIDSKIVLGVATPWSERKGLKDFIQLFRKLNEEYCIFLVGLSKKQIKQLPDNVYGIEKTLDVHELIELYSSAYVFLNLTYEDNYPTTNIEAQACGTPVISYRTGGNVVYNLILKKCMIYFVAQRKYSISKWRKIWQRI